MTVERLAKAIMIGGLLAVAWLSVGFKQLCDNRAKRQQGYAHLIASASGSLHGALVVPIDDDKIVYKIAGVMENFGASLKNGDYYIGIKVDSSYKWIDGSMIFFVRDSKIIGAINYKDADTEMLEYYIARWAIKYRKDSRLPVGSTVKI